MSNSLYDLIFSPEVSELNIHKTNEKISVSFEIEAPIQSVSGSNNIKSEHAIQNEIQIALSKHQCNVFRANVGKIRLPDGRFFNTGLPNGFPDLVGFRWTDGKIFFIEVKNAKGRLRPDQIVFHKMLQSHNIIHGVARSVEDALMIADGGLTGYGY
ncbi:VRR-NUC domain-containing protein [Lactobacillus helveticus]|nr:VRR-NUC domain-containing protein [Lactobacillus helveticus]